MTAYDLYTKADEQEARGRIRCAERTRELARTAEAREQDELDHATYLADLAAERRNQDWFIERGYRMSQPDPWDI